MTKFKIKILGMYDDFGVIEFFLNSPTLKDADGYAHKHAEIFGATVLSVEEADCELD